MRQRLGCINLRAHLLNLRGLFLQTGVDCLERRFQFLDLLVLFEELVEQHRIHCVVAYGVDLAISVAHHQIRVHVGYFLGNQTKLRRTTSVALVMERHRLERQERFAGFVHRFNLFLEPARGAGGPELTVDIYKDWQGVSTSGRHAANAGDKGSCLKKADASGVRITGFTRVTDIDIVVAGGEILAGTSAQGCVTGSSRAVGARYVPMAVLMLPVVLKKSAPSPVAVLPAPAVLRKSALTPMAVLAWPSVLLASA